MTQRTDTAGLIARTNLPDLIGNYIQLKRDGREHKGLCPFHDDHDPSFTVYPGKEKQRYKCFVCGAAGDALDFVQEYLDVDFKEAVRILGGEPLPNAAPRPAPAPVEKPAATWRPIVPVPDKAPALDTSRIWNPKRERYSNLRPTATYTYRGPAGELLGYVLRCEFEDGGKFTPQVTYCVNGDTGEMRWCLTFFPAPRPLYGLDILATMPKARVLVVEGEKCKEAAAIELPGFAVVSWPGGSNGVKHVDWSPLAGRDLTLWPDADAAGIAAMDQIAELAGAASVRILNVEGRPKGWDVADAAKEWSGEELIVWCRANVRPWVKTAEPERQRTGEDGASDSAGAVAEAGGDEYARGVAVGATSDVTRYRSPPLKEPVAEVAPSSKVETPMPDLSAATSFAIMWERLGLTKTDRGMPHSNISNAVAVLEQHPDLRGRIWFDEFLERIVTTIGDTPAREWSDGDDVRLSLWFQRALGIHNLKTHVVQEAVVAYALQCRRNECKEWLESLPWDGTDRLAYLMSDGFGAEQNDYTSAVGRCFMVGMVARVLSPGCKVDTMPILEGSQGKRKSTGLNVLAGKWFMEAHESVTSKDFYQSIQGKMLVEIGELHAFKRADVDAVKRMITCRVDRYRASYGRHAADHPRRGVFAGTANRDDWNTDETGARRFWPVQCGDVEVEWLQANREQLFAEAVARYRRSESWWDVPVEAAQREQEARRDTDAWEEIIAPWLESRDSATVNQALEFALGLPPERRGKGEQMRVGSILRACGFVRITTWADGKAVKSWRRSGKGGKNVQANLLNQPAI